MKYKIIGILAAIFILASSFFAAGLIAEPDLPRADALTDGVLSCPVPRGARAEEFSESESLIRNMVFLHLADEMGDCVPATRLIKTDGGLVLAIDSIPDTVKEFSPFVLKYSAAEQSEDAGDAKSSKAGNKAVGSPAGEAKDFEPFSVYTSQTHGDNPLTLYIPENPTEEEFRALKDKFSLFEKGLYSFDYDSRVYGYRAYADAKSFADWFIISELTMNYNPDADRLWLYEGKDGLFHLTAGDFSRSCTGETKHIALNNTVWIAMMVRDIDFDETVVKRYGELRKTVLSNAHIEECIARAESLIHEVSPGAKTDSGEIKRFISARLAWLDENIDSILQYGAESKNKEYDLNPY